MKTMLDDFTELLSSNEVISAAKTTTRGFTQTRKISLLDVLLFYTFRSAETTNKDITSYFSKLEKPKVSKQAMFKALDKTNSDVFPIIIRNLAQKFYSHNDYHTLDGYLVLACDGTKIDLPPTPEMVERYGGYLSRYVKTKEEVKKPQANCSVLIDVLNHVVLDTLVEPCLTSEIPMLFSHMENCEELLRGRKVILLCDRYYGSAEFFLYCQLHGYDFVTRAKSYMYKKYVCEIERDGLIEVPFNKAWYRRMKRDDCREYAQCLNALSLRVVKNPFEYIRDDIKRKQSATIIESTYFTSLESNSFRAADIVELYHVQRWDNETAFFDIKSHLEVERFNSGKYNIVTNEIYGKILCFTLCGSLYEAADEKQVTNRSPAGHCARYDYIPNMKYIVDTARAEHRLMQYLGGCGTKHTEEIWSNYFADMIDDLSRKVVPVRPGRHYKRWGRWMNAVPTRKFRIDGRRNPPIKKCFNTYGYMTVQK